MTASFPRSAYKTSLLMGLLLSLTCCYEFDVSPRDQTQSCRSQAEKKRLQLDYSFLYDYLTGTGAHNFSESVTIGFLAAYGQAQVVLGALPLAVEAVNNDTNLLPGRRLRYVAADIGTNPAASGLARSQSSLATSAITIMTQMRDNGSLAFIGPDDTCSSEALVAAAWNLPMISYRCSDKRVSDKRIFYTFARTLPSSRKVSKSVVALLKAFRWHRFVVVSGSHPASGSEVQEAIEELSQKHGLVVTETRKYTDYLPTYIDLMDRIVADTYQKTRERIRRNIVLTDTEYEITVIEWFRYAKQRFDRKTAKCSKE